MTPLRNLLACLGMGQGDTKSWKVIADNLQEKDTLTVGDLTNKWSHDSFKGLLRGLEKQKALSRPHNAYYKGLVLAASLDFEDKRSQALFVAGKGNDWHHNCTKERITSGFNPTTYCPDGRLFSFIPEKGSCQHLDYDEFLLVTDLFFLDAIANPEPSMGNYLPVGLPRQLGKVWRIMVAPPKPFHAGKRGLEKARKEHKCVTLRHQNARSAKEPFQRMVLSEEFQQFFPDKVVQSVSFVAEDDPELLNNPRNDCMKILVAVYRHKTLQVRPSLPARTNLITKAPLPPAQSCQAKRLCHAHTFIKPELFFVFGASQPKVIDLNKEARERKQWKPEQENTDPKYVEGKPCKRSFKVDSDFDDDDDDDDGPAATMLGGGIGDKDGRRKDEDDHLFEEDDSGGGFGDGLLGDSDGDSSRSGSGRGGGLSGGGGGGGLMSRSPALSGQQRSRKRGSAGSSMSKQEMQREKRRQGIHGGAGRTQKKKKKERDSSDDDSSDSSDCSSDQEEQQSKKAHPPTHPPLTLTLFLFYWCVNSDRTGTERLTPTPPLGPRTESEVAKGWGKDVGE